MSEEAATTSLEEAKAETEKTPPPPLIAAPAAPQIGTLSNEAIVTEGLTKRYGALTALDHLNLTLNKGDVFGFIGPNGAGKSTTMKILAGLLTPSEGRAYV